MNDFLKPLYIQLYDLIKGKIYSGEYKIGDLIPSERILVETYGLNRMTVRKSIHLLIEDELLNNVQGKGYYVINNHKKIALGYQSRSTLTSSIQLSGESASRKVLNMKIVPNENFVEFFESNKVIELIRRIDYNDVAYCYQKTYIPYDLFPDAIDNDFSTNSLYEYLDTKGHLPTYFKSILCIENQDKEVLDALQIDANDSVFFITYKGYDNDNSLVEYTKSYHKHNYSSYKLLINNK